MTLSRANKSKNYTGYRDDNIIGEGAYHAVNCAVPSLRGCTDLACNFTDLLIYAVEHTGEITDDTANQYLFQPFSNRFEYFVHRR